MKMHIALTLLLVAVAAGLGGCASQQKPLPTAQPAQAPLQDGTPPSRADLSHIPDAIPRADPITAAGITTVHVPTELDDIILKCLAKDPGDRYQSAREVGEALERVPRAKDWDRDEAQRWWREFRAQEAKQVTSDTETRTITIDLEDRA
jgi:serine/threonine protein kinase